jgi:asparagine synthase (glutamine-hydrolysing)
MPTNPREKTIMESAERISIPCFIKNKGEFYFQINKAGGILTENIYTVASDDRRIQVFLNGVIYNNNAEQLIEGFILHGLDYIKNVEGSFIIFLIEGTQFHFITDKTNSKKAYYAFIDEVGYISNNIDLLPKDKCRLNLEGIACFLANGAMLNSLTLFQEIHAAKKASIHTIHNGEISINRYWNFAFNYSSSSVDQQDQFKNELELLLIESIRRRYATTSTPALSLSAGYDSRGILGILHEKIQANNISCFSYALNSDPGPGTDASISKKLAEQCGYPHQIIRSYKGDFMDHLIKNAREGKCLSFFCDELDAWHDLAKSNQFSDVFVGDQCFNRNIPASGSRKDLLDSINIKDASGIRLLEQFIANDVYREMYQGLNKLIEDIFERTKEISHPYDKREILYFDLRVENVLLPWRENFCSQLGFVHNPYLDGDILEFKMKLPPQMRIGKVFFKNSIESILPELFSMEFATSSGYQVNWEKELQKHRTELISFIQETDSRLDEIISKKEIIDIINHHDSRIIKIKEILISSFNYLRRTKFAGRVINNFLGPQDDHAGGTIDPEKLVIRLLLIRIYLTE